MLNWVYLGYYEYNYICDLSMLNWEYPGYYEYNYVYNHLC